MSRPALAGPRTEPELPAIGANVAPVRGDHFEPSVSRGPALAPPPSAPLSRRPPARPFRPLGRGQTGMSVRRLQQSLRRLGFLSRADLASGPGVFGPRTERAVRDFQQHIGMAPSGRYDRETDQALRQALSA